MAGLFDFINKRRKISSPQISHIYVEQEQVFSGLLYKIIRDGQFQQFPLNLRISELRQLNNAELLETLEDLWFEGYLDAQESGYILNLDKFSEIPPELRARLEIPQPTKLNLKLGHESAVGSPHFKFVLEKSFENWEHLERSAKINGPWMTLPNRQTLLMDEEQYQFQQLIDQAPSATDRDQIFPYVAEVRNTALRHGYPMDDYLQHQEYLFVDQVDINLNYDQTAITFSPKFGSSEDISPEILDQMSASPSRYAVDTHNRKVFVKPSIIEEANQVHQIPPIIGANIPKFIENPDAFLPDIEGLDLSQFGERVKSLGIRVYRAQPFVHASEHDRGWFDLDFGFTAQDENGEVHETWEASEMQSLIEHAQENGEEFIEWNGNWLRLPKDAEEFVEATETAKRDLLAAGGLVDVTKLPYILEIYENISQLEFNQPILRAQQEMQDLGIFTKQPPDSFIATLKPFQTEGYIWMKSLHYRKLGGLLADDMGLGKTIQVISFLSYLEESGNLTPTLVIVPKTLMDNWEKEISKFAPSLQRSLYLHRGTERIKHAEDLKRIGITVTTYHTLAKDQLVFGQVDWQAIICDEAQAIKNPSTAASKVLKAMKSKFRLAMTGTPVENGLSELWSIMDYVQPGLLGSLSQFKSEFMTKVDGEEHDSEAERELLARISMVYKRRTKSEELGDQLPSKQSVITRIPLGPEQSKLYAEVLTLVRNKAMDGLQAIQKLKALSSHPGLIADQFINLPYEQVPKLQETINIIRKVQEKGEKVLIFTEYIKMQEILRSVIRDCFDINPMIINGMTDRRQEQVDKFNRTSGFDVMILSPKAAGTGLTITSANHVIHYTRWWNPAVENQATDRVYRIGQEKPVYVYYPIVADTKGLTKKGTVEEIVHQLLTEKQEMASSVIVSSRKLNIEEEILNGI
ncbi:DEAD/DEAH box helicase [Paenibacillus sp. JX-17]|uniref:DEAD/DEAH box helicase n=1 Tax=Paenibacillus lacisoli TaxID=3064525 RepID=A0ABT9CE66_9BACL|nr:DEAD/DEAH box helicase [Paenibacillus sp. JX-17]MDO7907574.1 DEAD/DEAH box helicase [Paenibacillus sp. JX-17]